MRRQPGKGWIIAKRSQITLVLERQVTWHGHFGPYPAGYHVQILTNQRAGLASFVRVFP